MAKTKDPKGHFEERCHRIMDDLFELEEALNQITMEPTAVLVAADLRYMYNRINTIRLLVRNHGREVDERLTEDT
jgi:hypothetical protein